MAETTTLPSVRVGYLIPDFEVVAYAKGEVELFNLSDFQNRWLVLFFYPADFSFICPTELSELADRSADFEKHNVQLASVSMDSVYVHKAWVNSDLRLKDIKFPMIADSSGDLSRTFGTYCDKEGMSKRGTFIIDPDGILVSMEITNNSFGRNVDELIRKIDAAAFVRANPGQACPASWKPGQSTIKIQLGKQNY
jgi:peroxiredoxin (alkyl hydroperoxide reductase subunit C)